MQFDDDERAVVGRAAVAPQVDVPAAQHAFVRGIVRRRSRWRLDIGRSMGGACRSSRCRPRAAARAARRGSSLCAASAAMPAAKRAGSVFPPYAPPSWRTSIITLFCGMPSALADGRVDRHRALRRRIHFDGAARAGHGDRRLRLHVEIELSAGGLRALHDGARAPVHLRRARGRKRLVERALRRRPTPGRCRRASIRQMCEFHDRGRRAVGEDRASSRAQRRARGSARRRTTDRRLASAGRT